MGLILRVVPSHRRGSDEDLPNGVSTKAESVARFKQPCNLVCKRLVICFCMSSYALCRLADSLPGQTSVRSLNENEPNQSSRLSRLFDQARKVQSQQGKKAFFSCLSCLHFPEKSANICDELTQGIAAAGVFKVDPSFPLIE